MQHLVQVHVYYQVIHVGMHVQCVHVHVHTAVSLHGILYFLILPQEERREKMLVERLMRQCQQERRIATQLMQIRREKDTIRNNRIFRQQQHEEMRMREFQEALEREAVGP